MTLYMFVHRQQHIGMDVVIPLSGGSSSSSGSSTSLVFTIAFTARGSAAAGGMTRRA